MIYPDTYYDDCHGLIPQLVLSAMILEAGNIRSSAYKNALQVDLSAANTFSFDGYLLTLQGRLPFTESRYLLTLPSVINRVSAMNSENVSMLTDLMGLPVAGFSRTAQIEVSLPPDIGNLSTGILVVEKRLAYLLLLQAKRNNLNILYNYLYYTRLAGELARSANTTVPYSAGNGLFGVLYNYVLIHPLSRSTSITIACLDNLYKTYPSLKRVIPATIVTLDEISDWLQTQMSSDNPITLPDLDFYLLVGNVAEKVAELRYQAPPHDPLGVVLNESGSDVSSEITSTGASVSPEVALPDSNPFTSGSESDPLVDRPSADYSSLTNNSPTTDSLPPC